MEDKFMNKHKLDILVVDDQLGVRSLLTAALGDRGYTVGAAANGAEGVQMAKEFRPRLILMDIKMPVKDGITALYEIKGLFPDMQIIMMTAYGEVDTIKQLKRGGAIRYFIKPFDIDEFINYVEKVLKDGEKAYA